MNLETITQEAMDRMRDYFPREEEKKQGNAGNGNRFNMEGYLNDYGVKYRVKEKEGKVIHVLDQCPFNSDHKDSSIISQPDGKIGFHCHHNSCQSRTWHDARQAISGDESLRKYSPVEHPKQTAYTEIKSPQDILSKLETWKEIQELEIINRCIIILTYNWNHDKISTWKREMPAN
jgi:hypothetical protein